MAAVLPQARPTQCLGVPPAQVCAVRQARSSGLGQVKGPLDTEAPADLVSVEGLWPPPVVPPMTEMELHISPFSEKGAILSWANLTMILSRRPLPMLWV